MQHSFTFNNFGKNSLKLLLCLLSVWMLQTQQSKAQCTTVGPDPSSSAWVTIAPTCAQQGPITGVGAGAYGYYFQPAMANTYCEFYLDPGSSAINCANFLWYNGADVGPITNCLNAWGSSLAPNGTSHVKIVASGTWNGNSSVLYYKYSTPTDPAYTVAPATACQGDNVTYTVSASQYTTAYNWTVSGSGGTIVSGQGTQTCTFNFSSPGAKVINVVATNNGQCNSNTISANLTVNSPDNPAFSYSAASYCSNLGNPFPTITGLPGGTFTATSGLFINPGSGEVSLAGSTPGGPYTVTYTTNGSCPATATANITVVAEDNGSFTYTQPSYCLSQSGTAVPTITGLGGGVFAATPAGLGFNSTTGEITFATSTSGAYSVNYITNGSCPDTGTASVTLLDADISTFTYSSASFCTNASANPLPTITGLTGGTFTSSPAGLTINAVNGQIDLANSTTGIPFIVTYTSNGPCPTSSTFAVIINPAPVVSFTGLNPSYCINDQTPVNLNGSPLGGSFSGLGTLPGQNTYNPSLTTTGAHPITYTYTDANSCTASSTQSVITNGLPLVTFSGLGTDYCISDNTPVQLTGFPVGGGFSGSGVLVDVFTPSAGIAGLQTITYTYTDPNGCTNTSDRQINIYNLPLVGFAGLSAAYCIDDAATPLTGFPSGGTFVGTGLISPTAFDPGVATVGGPYDITYTYTDANGCTNIDTQSTSVNDIPVVTLTGLNSAYCSNAPVATLIGSPVGGTLSGSGTNGLTFDPSQANSGTFDVSYVFTDANGCNNSVTQSVSVNPAPIVNFGGLAASYCQFDGPSQLFGFPTGGTFSGTGVTGTIFDPAVGPGNYAVTYSFTDANSCTNTAINNTTVQTTVPVDLGPDQVICTGNSTILDAGANYSNYVWSNAGSITQFNTVNAQGIYSVEVTDANGCVTSDDISILIGQLLVPVITPNGPTQICDGDSVTLTVGGNYPSILWSTSETSTSISVDFSGSITVTATDATGCSGTSAPITVNVMPRPVVNVTANGPTEFCAGGSVTLDAGLGFTQYIWSPGNVTSHDIVINQPDVYIVTVVGQNGCQNQSAPIVVVVNSPPTPTITASGPVEFCKGESVVLTCEPSGMIYLWCTLSNTQSITVTETGDYCVTVQDGNGCIDSSYVLNPIHVEVHAPFPIVSISGNLFTVTSTFVTYQWYMEVGGGAPDSMIVGATNSTFTASKSGTYYVVVSDNAGCEGEGVKIEHTYTSGIGINETDAFTHWNLYPNPASDLVTLELGLNSPSSVQITIVNANGQNVREMDLGIQNKETVKSFRVDQLATGLYSVIINADGKMMRTNFVKR